MDERVGVARRRHQANPVVSFILASPSPMQDWVSSSSDRLEALLSKPPLFQASRPSVPPLRLPSICRCEPHVFPIRTWELDYFNHRPVESANGDESDSSDSEQMPFDIPSNCRATMEEPFVLDFHGVEMHCRMGARLKTSTSPAAATSFDIMTGLDTNPVISLSTTSAHCRTNDKEISPLSCKEDISQSTIKHFPDRERFLMVRQRAVMNRKQFCRDAAYNPRNMMRQWDSPLTEIAMKQAEISIAPSVERVPIEANIKRKDSETTLVNEVCCGTEKGMKDMTIITRAISSTSMQSHRAVIHRGALKRIGRFLKQSHRRKWKSRKSDPLLITPLQSKTL